MSWLLRSFSTLVVLFLLAAMAAPALAAPPAHAEAKGLERAKEAVAEGVAKVRGNSANAPGQIKKADRSENGAEDGKLRGRERAAAAIAAALERGNGNGNAFGRGHGAQVHAILAAGGSPSGIAGEHGAAVSAMVRAFNQMKAERRPAG